VRKANAARRSLRTGPSGPAGVANSHRQLGTAVTANVNEGATSADAIAGPCTTGVLLSGGGQFTVNGKAALHDSYPTGGGTTGTWVVNFIGTGPGSSGTTTLQSYVICSGP
jgi:hypothetical protein